MSYPSRLGMTTSMTCLPAFALASLLLVAAGCQTAPSATTTSYTFEASWTEAGESSLVEPFAVAVDPRSGRVVVSDVATQQIVVLTHDGTFVRTFGGSGDGPGAFRRPTGLAVGPDGSIYVSDFELDQLQKFGEDGQLVRQWGDDDGLEGLFQGASGLAVDGSGRVYIADFANQRVHRLNDQGRLINTLGQAGALAQVSCIIRPTWRLPPTARWLWPTRTTIDCKSGDPV